MPKGGWIGRIARVNLTDGKVTYESLPEEVLKTWIGGRGLGVYLALKEIDPKVDPLSEKNKVIVATGPLTGTAAPASGRWVSITKSPLTDTIHDSHSGGRFGPELKFAGFDAIIIEGASEEPVYLWVHDGKVEIRDAKHLWGKDVWTTTDLIKEELGDPEIKVAAIGPAGERLSRLAAIINDYARAAGRGGHGAVWGSKKLKAIAVRGYGKVPIADEEKFREAVKKAMEKIRACSITAEGLPKYGTAVLVNIINKHGIFPYKNFQSGVMPDADKISGETLAEKYLVRRGACWGCPIGCARITKVPETSPFAGEGEGPEYETIWAFGADCGVNDLEAIIKANYLCNMLGLDTIEMGATIATLMELYEKGKIPREKLHGMAPKFGNKYAMVDLVWMTAYRTGIGDDLAEGGYRLAVKYGAPEVSMSVRKQSLPAYDPRGVQAHGLGYATSNRGGCHLRAYMIAPEVLGVPKLIDRFSTSREKVQMTIEFQNVFAVVDSLVLCKFVTFAFWAEEMAAMLSAATGIEYTAEDVKLIGERIWNAERVFNILAFGDGKEYDTLPKRLLEEPIPEGPAKGHVVRLNEMLPVYYELRGWKDGRPTRATLERLGLKELADRLEKEGLLPE